MNRKLDFFIVKYFSLSLLISIAATALIACGNSAAKALEQIDLGHNFLSEENYEEAILAFTKAIEIDDQNADAYVGRANAYIFSNETDETFSNAEADYKKALELDHKCVNAYLGLADLAIRQNDIERALQILEDALTVLENNEEISKMIENIKSGNIIDLQGRSRKRCHYDGEGNFQWYSIYSYDEKGREKTISSFDANNIQIDFVENQYDKNGNLIYGYSSFNDDGFISKSYWQYDEKGNIIESKYENGEIYRFEYDENNQLLKHSIFLSDGSLSVFFRYYYDNMGQNYKYEQYGSDNELQYRNILEYNDKQQVVKKTVYNSDGKISIYEIHFFNNEGNVAGYDTYFADGSLYGRVAFNYNKEGNISSKEIYNSEGMLTDKIEYE